MGAEEGDLDVHVDEAAVVDDPEDGEQDQSCDNESDLKKVSTVGRLVLTSSDQLLLILKNIFPLFNKTSYLNEEVNHAEPSRSFF